MTIPTPPKAMAVRKIARAYGLMVARVMVPEQVRFLVDLGPLDDKKSRDCADRLMAAGVSRKNFSIEGNARILVMLSPQKAQTLIRRFRFKPQSTYWQTTHCRAGLGVKT